MKNVIIDFHDYIDFVKGHPHRRLYSFMEDMNEKYPEGIMIPDETLSRWRKTMKEYEDLQEELRLLY